VSYFDFIIPKPDTNKKETSPPLCVRVNIF